jgi:hypothetical protein
VIQVGGRKQLGMSFGSGSSPDCRGFTLEEINKIDWDKVDFAEFIEDLKVKFGGGYKAPSADDLKATIEGSLSSIDGFDRNLSVAGSVDSKSFDPNNPSNRGGFSGAIKDDSWETLEEKRLEDQKKERIRLAKIEAERIEKTRLAKIERLRLVRIKEQKRQTLQHKKRVKQQEYNVAYNKYDRSWFAARDFMESKGGSFGQGSHTRYKDRSWYPEFIKLWDGLIVNKDQSSQLASQLSQLNSQLEALK